MTDTESFNIMVARSSVKSQVVTKTWRSFIIDLLGILGAMAEYWSCGCLHLETSLSSTDFPCVPLWLVVLPDVKLIISWILYKSSIINDFKMLSKLSFFRTCCSQGATSTINHFTHGSVFSCWISNTDINEM